jgi:hypothetical protein
MDLVGVRIQSLSFDEQALTLSRLAVSQSPDGRFAAGRLNDLFDQFGLPRPAKISNVVSRLEKKGQLTRAKGSGRANWQLTPLGRAQSSELASDMDLAALGAESAHVVVPRLADTPHPTIPPSLSPPELIAPLHAFLDSHPFERNVFGMTRFPKDHLDPIAPALEEARKVCACHGLEFHLAADRQIVDDLWANVAAHLWGSQYAIAFYEERTGTGLNYNLNIEVGSALVLGRRLAVLKDEPVERLPTDLVGHIYKEVDLNDLTTIGAELHKWVREDLALGPCSSCAQ